MTKQGWLTKQFDSAKKDVEELPRWLQEKTTTKSDDSTSSQDGHVVKLRDAKVDRRGE
jgi:hypothetical protein